MRSWADAGRTAIFIDQNNTVYIQRVNSKQVEIKTKKNVNSLALIPIADSDLKKSALFVTADGDIYIANVGRKGQVKKWRSTYLESVYVTFFSSECSSIFIDTMNHLYCSMKEYHLIAKKSLCDNTIILVVVAGVGYPEATEVALREPHGIFVTIDFHLYVADTGNHRVQLYIPESPIGVTVAGTSETIKLSYPTGVTLDGDNHLYIVDSENHRIVASSAIGFRCVIGCSGITSFESGHLEYPINMAFDTDGHIYVTSDSLHGRIQKFTTSTPICSKYKNLFMHSLFCFLILQTTNGMVQLR